jgi:hypothetical protein
MLGVDLRIDGLRRIELLRRESLCLVAGCLASCLYLVRTGTICLFRTLEAAVLLECSLRVKQKAKAKLTQNQTAVVSSL